MKNQNNLTKAHRIGNVTIYVVKATEDFVIFKLTGRENGFETGIKISIEQAKNLYNAIYETRTVTPVMKLTNISGVFAKHRELTKLTDEKDFTYKYYESREAEINVISKGGHCIVSISEDKDYRTFSFRAYDYEETFRRMAEEVKRQMFKYKMDNWY